MADVPEPEPGLVIRYNYLWRDEHAAGQESGSKARPAVIISVVPPTTPKKPVRVAVLPITHLPHSNNDAIPLPPATAKRLGLDDQPMWIVNTELNVFEWPGYDLELIPGRKPQAFEYGLLPETLIKDLRARVRASVEAKTLVQVRRD